MGDRMEDASVEFEVLPAHCLNGKADLCRGLGVGADGFAGEWVAGEMDDVAGGVDWISRIEQEAGAAVADGVEISLDAAGDAWQSGVHRLEHGERQALPTRGGEIDVGRGEFACDGRYIAEQEHVGLDSEAVGLLFHGGFERTGSCEAKLKLERGVETAALRGHSNGEFGVFLMNETSDNENPYG